MVAIPKRFRRFFWSCAFGRLRWDKHRRFVAQTLLERGDWDAQRWLRRTLGDDALREHLLDRDGAGLDARRLRYWETVLHLPSRRVGAWVRKLEGLAWERAIGA